MKTNNDTLENDKKANDGNWVKKMEIEDVGNGDIGLKVEYRLSFSRALGLKNK